MRVTERAQRLDTYLLFERLPTGAHTTTMSIHNELLGRAVFVATISVHLVEHFDGNPVSSVDEYAGGIESTTKGFGSETVRRS